MTAPTLRTGDHYRLRNGSRVGPLQPNPVKPLYPWKADVDGAPMIWTAAGRHSVHSDAEHPLDIVRPVRAAARDTPVDLVSLDQFRRCIANMGSVRRDR